MTASELALVEAIRDLTRYVRHRQWCAAYPTNSTHPCTCGLSQAKERASGAIRQIAASENGH